MSVKSKLRTEKRNETKDTRPKAVVRHIRISPDKVRIVINLIRGKSYEEAITILKGTPRSASPVLVKLLDSCAANAEHNNHLSKKNLYIAEIFADQGATLKRMMPRAKGRGVRINKKTSHITVVMDSRA